VAVPEQIRKQSEAVEAFYNGADPATGQETPPPAGEAKPDEQSTTQPTVVEGRKEDEETYEQRFRTLQGMYNAEVPQLHRQVKEANQRMQQMESLLATMPAEPVGQQQDQYEPKTFISNTDVEEYGNSIDVMRKVSKEELDPVVYEIQRLRAQVESLQANVVPQVENVVRQQTANAGQSFWTQLQSMVPNWQEINNHPDFHTWLLEVDPMLGGTRQTLLEQAQQNFDAQRAASFFVTWQQLRAAPQPAPRTEAQPSELEQQVAPGRSKSVAPAGPDSGKPTYSRRDISKFFDDVRAGRYNDRQDERNRVERDIFAAQREGRISDA
jgi:hypothetical protein